jgi:hypothetical protein
VSSAERVRLSGRTFVLLALLACAAVLPACTRGAVDELPAPPPTRPATSTTARPDLSGVALAGVPGTTSTSVLLGPGKATLSGVVSAPDGVVPGATVLLERLEREGVATAVLSTGPDGRWEAANVLGGRWRIRAWRAPDLAQTTPESVYVEEAEKRQIDLKVEVFRGVVVTSSIAPSPPLVDEPANLVVRAFTRSVDENGIVRNQVLPSVEMSLAGSSNWRVDSANPTQADSSGRASWLVRCTNAGSSSLAVRVANSAEALPLRLPACALTAEEPPAEEPPADDGSGSTTSTTRRRTTTSTTEG